MTSYLSQTYGGLMKRVIAVLFVLVIAFTLNGCATSYSHNNLKRKVDDLEKKIEAIESAKEESTQRLRDCLIEADDAYWAYIRLNGKDKGNGRYEALQYIWDQARQRKLDKIEECKLLYPSK